MAAPLPPRGCFTCGSLHHFYRECPQRTGGYRSPVTGANAIPTGQTLLALPAHSVAGNSLASTPGINQSNAAAQGAGYQNNGYYIGGHQRSGFWKANQERLDVVYSKYLEDKEKETKQKEEEEKNKRIKEEEERRGLWKKEREQLELEMGVRIDKKLELVCSKVKVNDQAEAGCSRQENDELVRLRRENEDLRRALLGETEPQGDMVKKLEREIGELRRQVLSKGSRDDEMVALKHEIEQLRESTVKEQKVAGLKRQIADLQLEARQWKDEALRPGNKRGNIAVATPESNVRATRKPRWTDNHIQDGEKMEGRIQEVAEYAKSGLLGGRNIEKEEG
ncbi:hypothetical protein CBR_g29480 [Chara braunii]|uniref:CCHC-type domain-containing protein n=1 Tax=Chara braunii TaxID=69332 RepID=A0A388LAJ7_CHABU|nr:hypothetical protein CBR_g29480 [Chara braunii]|eukprot:GBG79330.1 hypothetical protein CBR_g29480 [Chara braunii]